MQTVSKKIFNPRNSIKMIIMITWNHNLTKLPKMITISERVTNNNKFIKSPLNSVYVIKIKGKKKVCEHILKFAILINFTL